MIIILDSISSQFTLYGGHIVYYINHEKKLALKNNESNRKNVSSVILLNC